MRVAAAADTVRAMKNKPVLDLSVPSVQPSPSVKEGGVIVVLLQQVLLPHLAAGLGLLLVTVYVGYCLFIKPFHLSTTWTFVAAVLLVGICGIFSFCYALLSAGAFALYQACAAWEEFIDRILEKVQEKALAKVEGLDSELAKTQAKVLIRGSVRAACEEVRLQETRRWPHWFRAICLALLTLAMRSVLVARIVKWSGTTIKISKIFAGKATLVGAVFLNLRFFALVLLGLVYTLGGSILLMNILLLRWIK